PCEHQLKTVLFSPSKLIGTMRKQQIECRRFDCNFFPHGKPGKLVAHDLHRYSPNCELQRPAANVDQSSINQRLANASVIGLAGVISQRKVNAPLGAKLAEQVGRYLDADFVFDDISRNRNQVRLQLVNSIDNGGVIFRSNPPRDVQIAQMDDPQALERRRQLWNFQAFLMNMNPQYFVPRQTSQQPYNSRRKQLLAIVRAKVEYLRVITQHQIPGAVRAPQPPPINGRPQCQNQTESKVNRANDTEVPSSTRNGIPQNR